MTTKKIKLNQNPAANKTVITKSKPPADKKNNQDPAASFTVWIGSVQSLIIHSILFALIFVLGFLGVSWELLMLILTTAVSLEAIYLAIFIQMSINRSVESLAGVEENLDEMQEDVEEIQRDVDEIQEDVEEIAGDVDEIQVDVSDIQLDIDNIQADVDEMQEDVDVIQKGDKKWEKSDVYQKELLKNIHRNMAKVKVDLGKLKTRQIARKQKSALK